MSHVEFTWKTADGASLFARRWEPQAAPKAVVCLVHGLGEHSGRYEHVAARYTQAGYALMALDLRGHGKSSGPRGHYPTFECAMDDIALLLDQASQRYPARPRVLYGHSLGGNLVLNYALRRPPSMAAVIATSPGLRAGTPPARWKLAMGSLMYRVWPGLALGNGLDFTGLSRDPEVKRAYDADPLVHDRVSVRFGVDFLRAGEWALERAATFPVPVLVMVGSADRLVSVTAPAEFAIAAGSCCTFKVWDGLYHETHNEPEQQHVIEFALAWLDRVIGQPRTE